MKKRLAVSLLSLTVLLSCLVVPASATVQRASLALSNYYVTCAAGSQPGEIVFTYDLQANNFATHIGITSIAIYERGGAYVTTIFGSTSNGLIATSTMRHRGSHPFQGTSGISYYASVTIFASNSDGNDYKTVQTALVTAP